MAKGSNPWWYTRNDARLQRRVRTRLALSRSRPLSTLTMHKNSRLITVVRLSGKRLYGGSATAQLKVCARFFPFLTLLNGGCKTDSEDNSLPSAKSWARPPQTRPSAVTRHKTDNEGNSHTPSLPSTKSWARPPQTRPSAVSSTSGSHSPRDLGKWTTKREPPKNVDIEETPSAIIRPTTSGLHSPRDLGTKREVPNNVGISEETPSVVIRPILSSALGSHAPRDLGKWTTNNEAQRNVGIEKTPSAVTHPTMFSGSHSPRDLGKWTTKEGTPSTVTRPTASGSLSPRDLATKVTPSVVAPPIVSSPLGSYSQRDLGKWTSKKDLPRNIDISEDTHSAVTRPTTSGSQSPRDLGKWTTKKEVQRNFDVSKETPSVDTRPTVSSRSQPRRDHGKWTTRNEVPRGVNVSIETPTAARPTVSESQSRDLENRVPRNVGISRETANASSSSRAENNMSSSRANLSPRPDYSSFQVFLDHDDPRRAPRRQRAVPERNTYHDSNRRGTILNKPLIKKSLKPRKKQMFRRKDVFIPTTLTVAMLARVLKVKLGMI